MSIDTVIGLSLIHIQIPQDVAKERFNRLLALVQQEGRIRSSRFEGDVYKRQVYWSTKKNPTTEQQNTTWRIGSGKGIKDGASYNIYIFLKKQVYNGQEWEDATPQDIKYITGSNGKALTFTAASISDKEWNAYIAELSGTPIPDNNGGNGGSGDDADAELTATAAASEKDAGSKSKSAVSTADESPIGTMSALAALSLLAGEMCIRDRY